MGVWDRLFGRRTAVEAERPDPLEQARLRVQENPNDPSAYFDVGSLHYVHEQYEDAVRELTRAIELSPDHAEAHYMLGLAYERLGQFEEARRAFETAREKTKNAMLRGYAEAKLRELEQHAMHST